MYLEVDSNKTCYVILPDGSSLKSSGGVIDSLWRGFAGRVRLIVPKNSVKTDLANSAYIGEFTTYKIDVRIENCFGITGVNATSIGNVFVNGSSNVSRLHAPLKTWINAQGCALPLANIKSILDNAYTLYLANNAIVVNINLSGGTNAAIDLNDVSAVHIGQEYGAMVGELTINGTVTLNTV